MTILVEAGDGIRGKRIVYVARKVEGPWLVRKSGSHRGVRGTLYDAVAYVERPIEGVRR
jgi:hypothetical protein